VAFGCEGVGYIVDVEPLLVIAPADAAPSHDSPRLSVVVVRATASNPAERDGGRLLPRFAALRRTPFAAFEERKKRLGTFDSKMSDNEHAAASLGDSEVSRVQHSPRHAIPEVGQRRENDGEISATVRGKESGYVLNEEPAGVKSVGDPGELEEQRRARAFEPRPFASDAEVLAGEAATDEIRGSLFPVGVCSASTTSRSAKPESTEPSGINVLNGIHAWYSGPPSLQDSSSVGVNLDLSGASPSGAFESEVESPDAREEREEGRHSGMRVFEVGGPGLTCEHAKPVLFGHGLAEGHGYAVLDADDSAHGQDLLFWRVLQRNDIARVDAG
jgi:hypothetical protein